MSKVKRTYRLEQGTLAKLEELAKSEGITVTDALERAISAYGSMPDESHTEGHTETESDSRAIDALSKELEALHRQLEVKDAQIATLGDALQAAQDTAKAAQALHAATSHTMAIESGEKKKGRLERLIEAFRG